MESKAPVKSIYSMYILKNGKVLKAEGPWLAWEGDDPGEINDYSIIDKLAYWYCSNKDLD